MQLLTLLTLVAAGVALTRAQPTAAPSSFLSEPILADFFDGAPGFYHGVASGDPLFDAVILWTRYTPISVDDEVLLEFRMAEIDPDLSVDDLLDPASNPSLRRGTVRVTSETDFVAKIDVTGLTSNTKYVYSFNTNDEASDVGLTRTAPRPEDGVTELRYALFSCSNYVAGWFHAYDIASTIQDLDLWIHVGDVIYVRSGRPVVPKQCCTDSHDTCLPFSLASHRRTVTLVDLILKTP